MRGSTFSALIVATCLAACGKILPVPTTVVTAGMPNPEEALKESMHHVDAEMAELGGMHAESARNSVVANAVSVIPEDLQRIVSFTWSGSLDKGVAKLAQSIGYTFYTTALPNAPPLDVAVQVRSAPAVDVFKALGEEAGNRATVEVDPFHHQVQVIHRA